MSWKCDYCDEEHEQWPKHFSWNYPIDFFVLEGDETKEYIQESKYFARIADRKHYIRCEIRLPFYNQKSEYLSFQMWLGVSRNNYQWYKRYRDNESDFETPPRLPGYFCSSMPALDDETIVWAEVWFNITKGDPIPLIEIDDENNPLDSMQRDGISHEYWHEVIKELTPHCI